MNKLDKPSPREVVKGSRNLLKILVVGTDGRYKAYEQQAMENVANELERLWEMEDHIKAKGIEV